MELELAQLAVYGRLALIGLAYINLMPGARPHLEAGRAHHCFHAGMVRRPPVRRISFHRMLDERHARPAWPGQPFALEQTARAGDFLWLLLGLGLGLFFLLASGV